MTSSESDEGLSVVDPANLPDAEPGAVASVLFAGGSSQRFGPENKLLAGLEGEPVVRRAARTLVESRVAPVVVVLGHEAERVERALADLPVEFAVNEDHDRGLSTSVRTGIEAIRERAPEAEAAVLALGDLPAVDPGTVDALIDAHAAGAGTALAAAHGGRRGNPVLFDRRHFDALATLSGDVGGREVLLGTEDGGLVAVDDPGVRRDVNRPEDLADLERE